MLAAAVDRMVWARLVMVKGGVVWLWEGASGGCAGVRARFAMVAVVGAGIEDVLVGRTAGSRLLGVVTCGEGSIAGDPNPNSSFNDDDDALSL